MPTKCQVKFLKLGFEVFSYKMKSFVLHKMEVLHRSSFLMNLLKNWMMKSFQASFYFSSIMIYSQVSFYKMHL